MSNLPSQSPYNRGRPFLVINPIRRPAPGTVTHLKGWGDADENWSVFEQRSVVDNVTPKLMTEAAVIIDVLNKRAVKNRYENADDDVVQHYLNKYKEEVVQAMNTWLTREAMKKARETS